MSRSRTSWSARDGEGSCFKLNRLGEVNFEFKLGNGVE